MCHLGQCYILFDIGGGCRATPPDTMSLIAWNARGLGDPRAFNKLRMIVRSFSPGLVFISETKLSGRRASLIKDRLGFEYGVHVDSVGRSGGLALVRTKDWDVVIQSFSRAYIDAFITSPDGNSRWFTRFYGHPEKAQRHHCWELLRRLRGLFTLPWLVAGDFNEILHSFERKGGRDRYDSSMRGFGEAVNDCELIDLGFPRCGSYVEQQSRPPRPITFKRDWISVWRILVGNLYLIENGSSIDIFFGSDHKALHVVLDFPSTNQYVVGYGNRRFTFEILWRTNDGCVSFENRFLKISKNMVSNRIYKKFFSKFYLATIFILI